MTTARQSPQIILAGTLIYFVRMEPRGEDGAGSHSIPMLQRTGVPRRFHGQETSQGEAFVFDFRGSRRGCFRRRFHDSRGILFSEAAWIDPDMDFQLFLIFLQCNFNKCA